jgi:hypothetical protein
MARKDGYRCYNRIESSRELFLNACDNNRVLVRYTADHSTFRKGESAYYDKQTASYLAKNNLAVILN